MSSALQSSLTALQQRNYLCLILLTAVGYDYILILPKEIEFIWRKPWSWVSTLFILVRYCGLCSVVIAALGEILHDIEISTYILFLGAADFVMILRVRAMYNQSRRIFSILLTLFFIEIVSVVVANVVYSNPKTEPQVVAQVLGYSFCTEIFTSPVFAEVTDSLQIAFAMVLCTFAIIRFARELLQMYNATKQWQLNRYINLLVTQGVLYFFAFFLLNLIDLLGDLAKIPVSGWQSILAYIVGIVPVTTLAPRFTLSMRDLYAQDVQGRRGAGIDSGFGLSSLSSQGGAAGSMVFAAGVQSEVDDEQDERRGNIETED